MSVYVQFVHFLHAMGHTRGRPGRYHPVNFYLPLSIPCITHLPPSLCHSVHFPLPSHSFLFLLPLHVQYDTTVACLLSAFCVLDMRYPKFTRSVIVTFYKKAAKNKYTCLCVRVVSCGEWSGVTCLCVYVCLCMFECSVYTVCSIRVWN